MKISSKMAFENFKNFISFHETFKSKFSTYISSWHLPTSGFRITHSTLYQYIRRALSWTLAHPHNHYMTHNYIIPTYGLEAWSAIFYGRIKSFLFHTLIRCGQVTQTGNTGLATGVLKIIQDLAIKKPRKPQIIRVRFIHKFFCCLTAAQMITFQWLLCAEAWKLSQLMQLLIETV